MTTAAQPIATIEKDIEQPGRRIPRLNERVFIGRYDYPSNGGFSEHCAVIRKCGLVAEVEKQDGKQLILYAARRRNRKAK